MKLNRIVVAIDFSEASLVAWEAAFNLALGSDATMYLLHVVESTGRIDLMAGWAQPSDVDLCEEALYRLGSLVPDDSHKEMRVERYVVIGSPVEEIARFAKEKKADMIVVGTHGRTGLARVLMGSTAEGLLREAPCQVLVVKPHAAAQATHAFKTLISQTFS